MKACYVCKEVKDESKYPKSKATLKSGEIKQYVERTCYSCKVKKEKAAPDFNKKRAVYRSKYNRENPCSKMYWNAKSRAKKKGLEFNLDKEDIVIPQLCPLIGIELQHGMGNLCDASPSLDRIDSSLGYVKGNVWVISHKANTMKSDATLAEIEMLVTNLRKKLNDYHT
jgi:hypothetical protein